MKPKTPDIPSYLLPSGFDFWPHQLVSTAIQRHIDLLKIGEQQLKHGTIPQAQDTFARAVESANRTSKPMGDYVHFSQAGPRPQFEAATQYYNLASDLQTDAVKSLTGVGGGVLRQPLLHGEFKNPVVNARRPGFLHRITSLIKPK